MNDVTMPGLSDSVTEATVVRWLKEDGEPVERGDELLEIETEKATMSYEAEAAGLLQILVPEGTTVPVGTIIGRIGEARPAQDIPATAPAEAAPPPGAETTAPIPETVGASDGGGAATTGERGPVRATPLARLLARTHGIDLATVQGTGPRGRVTRSDVALGAGVGSSAPWLAPTPTSVGKDNGRAPGSVTVQELTGVQQVIARRMAEAKATVPEFQVEADATMDEALALREQLRPLADEGTLPSLTDLVIRASALALREHPRVNGAYRDGRFELYSRVNVGFAVAAEDALIVPVVTDADCRSLVEIAAETRRLAELARSGRATPADLADGTFTVSNLGMFGMRSITPVVNPPQAAILGVGAIREELRLHEGNVTTTRPMALTLTCDHRILYGADAAGFLSAVRDLLEQPLRLLL